MGKACTWHGRGIHAGFRWESKEEINRYEDLDVYGRIILKKVKLSVYLSN
jgi:hypothetical protein